jgi:hypothetical protein
MFSGGMRLLDGSSRNSSGSSVILNMEIHVHAVVFNRRPCSWVQHVKRLSRIPFYIICTR